ncbi:ABC transporter permease [Micromonospora mangrovi]|uniref:ABC transporter permease n=2 Tax=Micromonospora TaxID=1873 RepID=A0AAU7MCE0_9ACTN
MSAPATVGVNRTILAIEIRRILRNRRTLVFVVAMPALFFLAFGLPWRDKPAGARTFAVIMIGMAVYGAMVATTACGAAVAVERGQGWSRQLRLTPLRPAAYVAVKVATAMVLGLVAVLVEYALGAAVGVRMPLLTWLESGLAAWLCSLVFAAFGLFVGFLLPAENVMQILGPLLALLALGGGLFLPLDLLPHAVQVVAAWTPAYGVGVLARAPLTGGPVGVAALAVAAWTMIFMAGAIRLFRRDTARV